MDQPKHKQLEELQLLCHKVFVQSQDGKRLHELLVQNYIVDMPIFNLAYPNHRDAGFIREGNNELIRHLIEHALIHEKKEQNARLNTEVNANDDSRTGNSTEPFSRPKTVRYDD